MSTFSRDVNGISALADDLRRDLYLFVASQPEPVGREQAARALGVPAHQAKFHLDRLEEAGLLESEYVRLTGRSGPGAGRPAKTYHRAPDEIAVSLPDREYALAGELMAEAIEETAGSGAPVEDALLLVAHRRGRRIGAGVARRGRRLEVAAEAIGAFGYEPRLDGDDLVLANCPFHALAATHGRLVCGMNRALLEGVCAEVGGLDAVLDPGEGRCCVVVKEKRGSSS